MRGSPPGWFRSARPFEGMMLSAVPACTVPTVTTPGTAGSSRRETSVCSAVISAAAPTIGSADFMGPRAWAPGRSARSVKIVGGRGERSLVAPPPVPPRTAGPRGRPRWPTPSSAPLASTAAAPSPFLRRLQQHQHVAVGRRLPSSIAAPTAQLACTSCPHACMTPGFPDASRGLSLPRSGARRCRPRITTVRPPIRPRDASEQARTGHAPDIRYTERRQRRLQPGRGLLLFPGQLRPAVQLASRAR